MPWRTLCGFPPTTDTVTLRIPNGAWRPDTVITDYEGTEMFVLLDQVQEMRSYEAIFGDLEGRRLVCIKRHLIKAFWRDGYYLCTYKPNYKGQRPLTERDVDNKKVFPFSYLQVNPMKGRFFYRYFDNQEGLGPPRMRAMNPWLGFMIVCATPMVRCGKWTASFKRRSQHIPTVHVDQWRNCVDVGPGNDLLAALCLAYIFDRYQCQPLVTVFGNDEEELESDDKSIASGEDLNNDNNNVELSNVPDNVGGYRDDPEQGIAETAGDGEYSDHAAQQQHPTDGYYDDDGNYHNPYYDNQAHGDAYYEDANGLNEQDAKGGDANGNYDNVNQADEYDDHFDDGAFDDPNSNNNSKDNGEMQEDLLQSDHHSQASASKPEIV